MRHFPRIAAIVLNLSALILSAWLAGPAWAQKQAPARGPVELYLNGREDGASVDKVLSSAGRTGAQLRIRVEEAGAAPAAEAAAPATPVSHAMMLVRGVMVGIQGLGEFTSLPAVFAEHWRANQGQLDARHWLFSILNLLVSLAAAAAIWWLVRWALGATRARVATPSCLRHRLAAAIRIAIADLAAVGVFYMLSRALNDTFVAMQSKAVAEFHAILLDRTLPVLMGIVTARFMLGQLPGGERLLPVTNAGRYLAPAMIFSLIGGIGLLILNVLYQVGASPAQIAGAGLITSTIVMIYRAWFFWSAREGIAELVISGAREGAPPGRLRLALSHVAGKALAVVPVLIWALGIAAVAAPGFVNWIAAVQATNFFVVFGPLISAGSRRVVHDYLAAHETADITPLVTALHVTVSAGAAAVVWVLAAVYLEESWSHYLDTLDSRGLNLLRALQSAALTLVAGYLGWVFLKALFDGYTPKRSNGLIDHDDSDGATPTIQSRLGSVMPVMRGVALALILVLTLLFGMTQLGLDTGPLLAGFGIAGLALSFGSQALVRDVVSGIFFLADDAFRVGEYIDTGKLKGTVEKLSLRSVQLRHQSGLVHTIPYGQLQGVTNASRDWATIKFTIRLDREADIEKARKTIKKVGLDMLTHEEFGSDFIMPVKMQGITDIQDNALIVRIKFTAKPFRTSQIQREALKRIYIGLNQAKVSLATTEVRVRGGAGGNESAAAAHSAVTQAQAAALPLPVPAG